MKLFKCQHCARLLHFENRQCENCGHRLGFLPRVGLLSALEPAEDGAWQPLARPQERHVFCANAEDEVCNWLVPAGSGQALCTACRHNRTIPDLGIAENVRRWRRIEQAKHHLFYSLLRLRLRPATRVEDPATGLAFDFLAEPAPGTAAVMTGHDNGIITLNLEEADDALREKARANLGEPYRTLLGHFRHEIGHYYWDRLVRDGDRLEACRAQFGDERGDYDEALKAYYADGPASDWQTGFVSAYASAHPWEDFAETWAHYLHIVDTLEMARSYGLSVHPVVSDDPSLDVAIDFDPHAAQDIDQLLEAWLPVTLAVNSINRCMGVPDLYPFVLSSGVRHKLGFIHALVHGGVPADLHQPEAA